MNILNELNEACNYIENNIENEIDIKEIARITNQSTDSINRFFVSMLGITIKEYIRKRRLSLAVYDLQNSDEKIGSGSTLSQICPPSAVILFLSLKSVFILAQVIL